jgi:pseudouridine-5'-phosphate glycosidase
MHRVGTLTSHLGVDLAALPLKISPEVQAQLARPNGAARVVALESTIISHGMPYPQNVECARSLEAIVRAAGAVPATIAILGGVIHVGLAEAQLLLLAKLGTKCLKCSRRDLPLILAQKQNGATTVSGTILIAHMLGIAVMGTGGIGGVHRGGEASMDVSADLLELGRTPMLVVCAGVKSILDIPRTLEVLETQGVSVMSYQTAEFPAFFTRASGCVSPLTIADAAAGARYIAAMRALRFSGGGVLAVPLPAEAEADGAVVEAAIAQCLREVAAKRIGGRDVTPYVLLRLNELTGGASLAANLALVRNNVRVAAEIAVELHRMQS